MGNLIPKFLCTIATVLSFTLFGFDQCMQSVDTDCDEGRRSVRLQLATTDATYKFNSALFGCIDTSQGDVDFQNLPPGPQLPPNPAVTTPKFLTSAIGNICAAIALPGFAPLECRPAVAAVATAVDVTVCCRPYSSALMIDVSGFDTGVPSNIEPKLNVKSSPVDAVHAGIFDSPAEGVCTQIGVTEYDCDFNSSDSGFRHVAVFDF